MAEILEIRGVGADGGWNRLLSYTNRGFLIEDILLALLEFEAWKIVFEHLVNISHGGMVSHLGGQKSYAFAIHLAYVVKDLVAVIISLSQETFAKRRHITFRIFGEISNPVSPLTLIT
jgi:hypothetical protein